VEYFHVELDSHDVIIANGALAETSLDEDSRGIFLNSADYDRLSKDERVAPAQGCARRAEQGYEVEAARQKIARSAGNFTQHDIEPRRPVDNAVLAKRWVQNSAAAGLD
jgi:hypothetical protein